MTLWDDATKARAAKLWNDGQSASEVGAVFGCSRSAIMGIVHRNPDLFRQGVRLVKPAPKGGGKRAAQAVPSRPRRSAFNPSIVPRVPRPEVDDRSGARRVIQPSAPDWAGAFIPNFVAEKPLTLVQLTATTCRWPLWDDGEKNGLYCGGEAADGSSWCRHHRVMSRPGWKAQVAG